MLMLTNTQTKVYMASHVQFAMSSSRQNNSTRCHENVDKLQNKWTGWF